MKKFEIIEESIHPFSFVFRFVTRTIWFVNSDFVISLYDHLYPLCENYDADFMVEVRKSMENASVQRTLVNGEDKEILTRRFLFIYFSYYGFIP